MKLNFSQTFSHISKLAIIFFVCFFAASCTHNPNKENNTMQSPTTDITDLEPSELETLVRSWFQSYSDKDFEKHNNMIHPDAIVIYPEMCYVNPNASAGKEFLVKTLEEDEKAFIDLRQEIHKVSVAGNTAFVEGRFVGSKLGNTVLDDAKGSDINLRFIHRIYVEDRMIKEVSSYYDTALLYQIQLGLEGPTKENPLPPWIKAMSAKRAKSAADS